MARLRQRQSKRSRSPVFQKPSRQSIIVRSKVALLFYRRMIEWADCVIAGARSAGCPLAKPTNAHSTVRVVNGSAMPDPTCGNIKGSLLMMAEKAFDMKTGKLSIL